MKKIQVDTIIDLRSTKDFEKDKAFYTSIEVEVINMDFFKAPKEIENLDKNKTYFVLCDSGMFSDIITKVMLSKGFKNVKNLKGGIEELKRMVNENS